MRSGSQEPIKLETIDDIMSIVRILLAAQKSNSPARANGEQEQGGGMNANSSSEQLPLLNRQSWIIYFQRLVQRFFQLTPDAEPLTPNIEQPFNIAPTMEEIAGEMNTKDLCTANLHIPPRRLVITPESKGETLLNTDPDLKNACSNLVLMALLESKRVRSALITGTPPSREHSLEVQAIFRCPLTLCIPLEPMFSLPTCQTFEREAIERHLDKYDTCPCTRQPLRKNQLQPNLAVLTLAVWYVSVDPHAASELKEKLQDLNSCTKEKTKKLTKLNFDRKKLCCQIYFCLACSVAIYIIGIVSMTSEPLPVSQFISLDSKDLLAMTIPSILFICTGLATCVCCSQIDTIRRKYHDIKEKIKRNKIRSELIENFLSRRQPMTYQPPLGPVATRQALFQPQPQGFNPESDNSRALNQVPCACESPC